MFNIEINPKNQATQITRIWVSRVLAAGGGFENNSIFLANSFVRALSTKSYFNKIIYLLPMLGVGINAARVPLIDRLNVGAATNLNFVDADFSQATGLKGNGTNKVFDTLIKASQLSSSNNAGFGYWNRAVTTGNWSFASRPAQGLYGFNLAATPRELFYYGNGDAVVDLSLPVGAYNYYCQRSSSTSRAIYQNGTLIGSTSSSTVDSGSGGANIFLMGIDNTGGFDTDGQCSLAYLTDGSLVISEILDLHSILSNYLVGPTGKQL